MISVALPLYNQSDILPIALCGLSNQIGGIPYELIILTEDKGVGEIVDTWQTALKDSGMIEFKLIELQQWTPLPQKWRILGKEASEQSIGFLLQAGDCYPHPNRIKQSFEAMQNGYDWYHEKQGYFYDFNSKLLAIYRGELKAKTHLNMCVATKHVRNLPFASIPNGVDRWLFYQIQDAKVYTHESEVKGVDFNGRNNISHWRGERISRFRPPFYRTFTKLTDLIPPNMELV